MGRLDAATYLTAHSRHLEKTAKLTMFAAGLRSDDWVPAAGADWVADQVVAGRRDLGLDAIQHAVSTRALRSGSTRTIVSIATLTPDRLAAQATYAIDWWTGSTGPMPTPRRPKAPCRHHRRAAS